MCSISVSFATLPACMWHVSQRVPTATVPSYTAALSHCSDCPHLSEIKIWLASVRDALWPENFNENNSESGSSMLFYLRRLKVFSLILDEKISDVYARQFLKALRGSEILLRITTCNAQFLPFLCMYWWKRCRHSLIWQLTVLSKIVVHTMILIKLRIIWLSSFIKKKSIMSIFIQVLLSVWSLYVHCLFN